ncbi:uncharacterized protein [Euphorbia lathyris]|uniref:uncharacterized protein n=1 Tax=Euphorbia lathyris TaxID=212925 RepID=UPI003313F493
MRDGLRSRRKLFAEANEGDASLCKQTFEVDEASTGQHSRDSTDDSATKLIGSGTEKVKCISDSNKEAEMDERDGSKSEESGAGSDIEVLKCTNNKKKRSRTVPKGGESEEDSVEKPKSRKLNEDGKKQVVCRVLRSMSERDGPKSEESDAGSDIEFLKFSKKRSRTVPKGGESEEDSVEKSKSRKLNEDGKPQVVGRVLRSMLAGKSESKGVVQRKNVDGDSIGKRTRARGGSEYKSVNTVKSENKEDVQRKNIDGDCIGQRTRGRGGSEDKSVNVVISEIKEDVQKKNMDGCSIGKRTRGRGGSEDKSVNLVISESKEDDQKDNIDDDDSTGKRTMGRGGPEDKSVNLVISESKEDDQKENIDDDSTGKRTRGRGGPEDKSVNLVISESKEDDQKENIDNDSTGKRTRGRGGPEDKSADVVITEGKEEAQKKNIDGDSIGKRTRGRCGSEDNSLNVVIEEANQFNDEHHYIPETMEKNKVLGKRGRTPKSQECQELQEKWTDVKKGEIDQPSDQESHQLNNKLSKKWKRKRGRPRKNQESNESEENMGDVQKEEVNQFATPGIHQPDNEVSKKLKRKRGRPPKDEVMKLLKPRRGRPPKAQNSVLSEKKISHVKKEKVDQFDGRWSDHQNDKMNEKIKPRRGRPSKVNKGKQGKVGNECDMKLPKVKKMKCQKVEMEGGEGKKKTGEKGHSRLERQAVRDKIVELVLGAGWEIQYRPRQGRVYNDAVYVSPIGRTYWSITLAYRVLKQQIDDGTFDSKACKSGFEFIPIPEEELSILTKVMNKERSDKNKKKKKRNKDEEGELVTGDIMKRKWKRKKKELGPAAGLHHKKLKGRPKLKPLQHKKDRSGGMKGLGTAVSVRGRKPLETHGRKRCGLMARNSQDGTESDSDRYFLYNGKRTVLTWMIDLGTLALDGKVDYFNSRKMRAQLKGRIKTDGIQCDCCSKTYTIAEFEAHAGGKSCQPFENIFLETGSSLLQCQLDSWHKQGESSKKGFHFIDINHEDPNDDTCGICGDGGDLICCDGCPSTFHKSCLEIKKFPPGPWHCIYCVCKFCGKVGGDGCQENDDTAPPCGLLACFLCEEKYHQSCVQVKDVINKDPIIPSFCGEKCQKLHERLQMLLGVKHELEEGFSLTFVRRFDVGSDISLSGMPRKVDCNSKVAVALHVMDECFMPMVDHRSGVNLIRNIVYNFGSNFNRLNYTGFFTAILEKGDEMIAAASIRIHGNQLAEMPFIGTRFLYRRQGMCRRLLTAIETALCSLNVEKLVIPAISELRGTWSSVFGFKPFEESSKKILRNLNVLVFPGVDMLQKSLLNRQFTEQTVHPKEGLQSTELVGLLTMEKKTNKSDERCLVGVNLNDSSETGLPHLGNEINKIDANKLGSLVDGCLNDTSDIILQNANTMQCCHQSCMVSDNLDSSNVNIMSCQDSSCDAHQQTGNEKINSLNQRCLAGSNLEVLSETDVPHDDNIVGEPAAVESVSLVPDGCLNETSDITIQDASNAKCQDQLCVISGNLDGRNKNVVNLVDCSCNSPEQTAENAGQGNALSASIVMSTDSKFQPLQGQLNQHNVSEVDNKLCKVSHVGSGAANCSGEFPCASIDSSRTIFCKVKTGGKYSPNSSGKNYVHSTSEVMALQSRDSFVEHGVKVWGSDAAFCDSKMSIISSSVGKSTFPEAHQGTQQLLTAPLLIKQSTSCGSESKGRDGHEKDATLGSDDPRPNLHDSSSDAPCMFSEVVSGGGNVHDLKDVSFTAQNENGAPSTVGCLVSDTKLTASHSDTENAINVTQCNSESSCSLSSTPATSASGASEVIIVLNQAN